MKTQNIFATNDSHRPSLIINHSPCICYIVYYVHRYCYKIHTQNLNGHFRIKNVQSNTLRILNNQKLSLFKFTVKMLTLFGKWPLVWQQNCKLFVITNWFDAKNKASSNPRQFKVVYQCGNILKDWSFGVASSSMFNLRLRVHLYENSAHRLK